MTLSAYCGLSYPKPFTVKDLAGQTWSVATDKVWIAVVPEEGPHPRLAAGSSVLNQVLTLIKTPPHQGVPVQTELVLETLNAEEERFVQVLGVMVERERLITILNDATASASVVVWNSSEVVRVPSLGFAAGARKWYLTGWGDVEKFKAISLGLSLEDLLY